MARPKKAIVVDEAAVAEAQTSKDISELIYYTYVTYKGSKPDISVYKSGYKILEPLFRSTDENVRVYTLEQLKKVIDFLVASDVALTSFTILLWGDLVRAIVDDDKQATRYAIERLRSSQRSQGYYGDKTRGVEAPNGW